MKLKTPEFLQLYGTVHRQAFPQPFRFIRMCFNRRGHFNRLSVRYCIFALISTVESLLKSGLFLFLFFKMCYVSDTAGETKSFLIQQFCKTAAPKNFSVAYGSLFAAMTLKILQFFLDNRKKVCYTVRKLKIK